MLSFSEEKNANQNIEDLFSRLMEKQSGKEGENSEKETFLAHRYAIFLCSLDVEIQPPMLG